MQESHVVAGIDWAAELHAVCALDGDGKLIERFDVTHDRQALRMMVTRFRKAGVAKVSIERGDGPVVQALIDAGLAVFVVPSRQIKRSKPCGPVTAREATKTIVSTHTSLRTRYAPTATGGGRCGRITRKPRHCGRCAGLARIS